MKTLSLTSDWDLSLDSSGSLIVLSDNVAILQDVCSAARTWLGEVLYDTGQGIPYDTDILNSDVDLSFYASEIEDAATSVPGVSAATCHLANPTSDRQLRGVILVTFPKRCFSLTLGNTSTQGGAADAAFGYPLNNSQFYAQTWAGHLSQFGMSFIAIGM